MAPTDTRSPSQERDWFEWEGQDIPTTLKAAVGSRLGPKTSKYRWRSFTLLGLRTHGESAATNVWSASVGSVPGPRRRERLAYAETRDGIPKNGKGARGLIIPHGH